MGGAGGQRAEHKPLAFDQQTEPPASWVALAKSWPVGQRNGLSPSMQHSDHIQLRAPKYNKDASLRENNRASW